jgi:hypothetical protein
MAIWRGRRDGSNETSGKSLSLLAGGLGLYPEKATPVPVEKTTQNWRRGLPWGKPLPDQAQFRSFSRRCVYRFGQVSGCGSPT